MEEKRKEQARSLKFTPRLISLYLTGGPFISIWSKKQTIEFGFIWYFIQNLKWMHETA